MTKCNDTETPLLPSRPEWLELTMRCGQCDRDWDDWQPSNCSPLVWIAHVKTLRCPYCAAKRKLMIRLGPKEDPEVVQMPNFETSWARNENGPPS